MSHTIYERIKKLEEENESLKSDIEVIAYELRNSERAYEELYRDFEDAQNTIEYLELEKENK